MQANNSIFYFLLLSIKLCFHINGKLSNLQKEFPLGEELGLIFSPPEMMEYSPIHI